jgi:hypothetical protein
VSDPTNPSGPPAEITHLVRQRTEARARRDWSAADALKAEIEAAGWKIADHRGKTSVSRAAPPSVDVEGEARYGAAASVPSLLEQPPDAPWSAIVLASESPERVSRLLAGLRAHAPDGTQVVVVANDPSELQQAALAAGAPDRAPVGGRELEVLRTATRLGHAAALNIALRRAAGDLVLIADGAAWPTGDALTPLAEALSGADVAVAGAFGLTSGEPGRLRPAALAPSDAREAGALMAGWIAFRRSDYITLGPLDERFVTPAWLDVWWSLRLRAGADPDWTETEAAEPDAVSGDAAEPGAAEPTAQPNAQTEAEAGQAAAVGAPQHEVDRMVKLEVPAPRRAVRLDLPLEHDEIAWPPDRSRLGRRNMYRILERWGWREDLV